MLSIVAARAFYAVRVFGDCEFLVVEMRGICATKIIEPDASPCGHHAHCADTVETKQKAVRKPCESGILYQRITVAPVDDDGAGVQIENRKHGRFAVRALEHAAKLVVRGNDAACRLERKRSHRSSNCSTVG